MFLFPLVRCTDRRLRCPRCGSHIPMWRGAGVHSLGILPVILRGGQRVAGKEAEMVWGS